MTETTARLRELALAAGIPADVPDDALIRFAASLPRPAADSAPAAVTPPRATFYDSTDPQSIPGREYAALYYDGAFGDAGRAAAREFARVRFITVYGNAADCGIADFEAGNPVYENPAALRDWAMARHQRHRPARVYCDKSNAAEAWRRLADLAPHALWWVAVRDEGQPSPQELAADLAANWDAPIPEDRIWGCQYENAGVYDVSSLFLAW